MSFLDELTLDQRQLLVRLPYRVGLWISQSDATGGEASDAREMQALSNILHGFAEEVFGAEAIQFIISETVNNEAQWSEWGDDLDQVLSECERASGLISYYVGEKEARAFQMQIFDIAEAVAMAFTEHEHLQSAWQRFSVRLSYLYARLTGAQRSFEEFCSISAAERKALMQLSQVLGVRNA